MAEVASEDRYLTYREALRRRVCAICLDSKDDGSCGLDRGRTCALDLHGPRLINAMLKVRSSRMDEYFAALSAEICSGCEEQDGQGSCRLRHEGRCALAAYLPLIVDAIEETDA